MIPSGFFFLKVLTVHDTPVVVGHERDHLLQPTDTYLCVLPKPGV